MNVPDIFGKNADKWEIGVSVSGLYFKRRSQKEKTQMEFNETEHHLSTIDDVESMQSMISQLHDVKNGIHYKEITDDWFRTKIMV